MRYFLNFQYHHFQERSPRRSIFPSRIVFAVLGFCYVDSMKPVTDLSNPGPTGTLLSFLDGCSTQSGKRLLRRWICHPLQSIPDIEHRLDAVEELRSRTDVSSNIRRGLRKLPDLERLVARLRGLAACPKLGLIPSAARKVHGRRVRVLSCL